MTTLESGKCNDLWHLKHWNRLGIKACKKWSIVWVILAAVEEEEEKMRKTNKRNLDHYFFESATVELVEDMRCQGQMTWISVLIVTKKLQQLNLLC